MLRTENKNWLRSPDRITVNDDAARFARFAKRARRARTKSNEFDSVYRFQRAESILQNALFVKSVAVYDNATSTFLIATGCVTSGSKKRKPVPGGAGSLFSFESSSLHFVQGKL